MRDSGYATVHTIGRSRLDRQGDGGEGGSASFASKRKEITMEPVFTTLQVKDLLAGKKGAINNAHVRLL